MRRVIVLALILTTLLAPQLAHPTEVAASQPYTVHVVQPGDTLYSIALRYGVGATAIAQANGLVNPNYIYVGQSLRIPGSYVPSPGPAVPPASGHYTVQPGDTLFSIAMRFGTTVSSLVSVNGLPNPNYIFVGQVLTVPGSAPLPPAPSPAPPHCGYRYIVQPGDTLSAIAARHGMSYLSIARANGLTYPYWIHVGQSLHIPCAHPAPKPKPKPQPALQPANCPRDVQIVQPLEGEHVSGLVQIVGSANIDRFQFYKLEYAMGHDAWDNTFHSIGDVNHTAAWDTVLGTWYVGNMPAGPYTLRLTVVDLSGQFPRPCDVHIHVND